MRNKSQKFKDRQSVFLNLCRFNKISAHEKLNKQIIMPDLLNEVRESEQTEKLIWRCYIIMVRFSIICSLKKVLRRHFRTMIFSMSIPMCQSTVKLLILRSIRNPTYV